MVVAPPAVANPPPAGALHTVCATGCEFTSIIAAVDDAGTVDGDTIDVMPGTYTEQVNLGKRLIVQGHPGGPMPTLTFGTANLATFKVVAGGAGSVIQHLDIQATGSSSDAFLAKAPVSASDLTLTAVRECASLEIAGSHLGPMVTATSTGSGTDACVIASGAGTVLDGLTVTGQPAATGVLLESGATLTDSVVSGATALAINGGSARRDVLNGTSAGVLSGFSGAHLVSDSVVTSTAANGRAVFALPVSGTAGDDILTLRNVTAIATGNGSSGLEAQTSLLFPGQMGGASSIDTRNVIARGAGSDVVADPALSPCPGGGTCRPGAVTIDHSNFVTHSGSVVTPVDAFNQSGDPLFANGAVGPGQDFHLASAASPVIGAGAADASNGTDDRDGVAHPSPPSIGAYEYTGPPLAAGGDAGGQAGSASSEAGGGGPGATGTVADTLAPVFVSASLTAAVFAVDAKGPTEALVAARKASAGTTFRYALSEAGRVVFTIDRALPGRKVDSRCRKQSRTNRRKMKCTRYALFGRFAQQGTAGANSKRWSGKIGRKKLSPGSYRATLVAADTAGNRSRPKQLRFRVVRR